MWRLCLALVGCGFSGASLPDGGPDAAPPSRLGTGRHLLTTAAVIGGITSDGFAIYFEIDPRGHSVAKAIPLAGGEPTTIATSAGAGKQDIRFEVWGDTVLAWTDRGNRSSTLTVWSAATGPIGYGDNIRPGRAAVLAGKLLYERDITADTARIVTGMLGGPDSEVAIANSADSACWQDTDFARVGGELLVRYCPAGTTQFTLRSVGTTLAIDAVDARYGDRVVWRTSAGELFATSDGRTATRLAGGVEDFVATHDVNHLAIRDAAGVVSVLEPARPVGVGALALGAVSPDGATVLYATKSEDRGGVQPYTDVFANGRAIVPATTSCPNCVYDAFTADSAYALVLDPIDNSMQADGEGPIRAIGPKPQTFGSDEYTTIAIGGARILAVDAARNATLLDGWAYGLSLRDLATGDTRELARGAEEFAVDTPRTHAIVSFEGNDEAAGLWITDL